jgi:site-specific DNA-cytosine methylase
VVFVYRKEIDMNVLVACEESQRVCTAFREKGHNAFSCDILPCSGGHPEWHIMDDVLSIINPHQISESFCGIVFRTMNGDAYAIKGKWDLIIAFPPCTHLSSSGQWAYKKGKDINLKIEAIKFFMAFANADCEKIAIENPVGVMSSEWRKPNQIIHPWQFGHNAEKQTCLWLKGLPNLVPDIKEKPELEYFDWIEGKSGKKKRMQKWMYDIRCISDRKKRAEIASKTFPGIARAMADQWG